MLLRGSGSGGGGGRGGLLIFGGGVMQRSEAPGLIFQEAGISDVSCCVPLCTNNFRNSPGLAFYRIPKTRHIQQEYVRLPQKANLKLNSGFPRGKITQGTSSSFNFSFLFFFPFNSTFRFSYFELF